MDIEINEVQEIIKNLESGGELSIKEEKYLNVAKLCVKMAAVRDAATLEYDYLNDQIEYWKNKSINITEQRNELGADLPPLEHENVHYADAAEVEIAALRQRIAELESRTVTVKLTDINEYLAEVHDKTLNRALRLLVEGVRAGDVAAMRAASIKVEAE